MLLSGNSSVEDKSIKESKNQRHISKEKLNLLSLVIHDTDSSIKCRVFM